MSRTTRLQRANAQPRRARKVLMPVFMDRLKRQMKRMMIADGRIANPATREPWFVWYWSLKMSAARDHNTTGGTIYADTKSQAKAQIKRALGIKKGRLPSYVNIAGAPNDASPVASA